MRYLAIRAENLTKFYGQHRGIEDLFLEVEPGEVFGFLGPDGAGKTTTLKLLMAEIRPTYGNALLLGMDAYRHSKAIHSRVGYLPANFRPGRWGTAQRYLTGLAKVYGGESWLLAQELAAQFKLDLEQPLAAMSGEALAELGLVQAWMHRPDLLLLDEPARWLGNEALDVFYRLVRQARMEGRSVFLASSSVAEMERICDRVGVIHAGRLVTVERGLNLRARALRKVEMRFAGPVSAEVFARLPNVEDIRLEENKLRCTLCGDPDALIKLASQFRVIDIISQQPTLEEVFRRNYGIEAARAG